MTQHDEQLLRALAIVRDAEPLLEPRWDARTREGYVYTGGGSTLTERTLESDLAELARGGFVEAVFVERISLCANCGSHAVNVFEACLTCSSSNLYAVKTLLHFRCGYVGPVEAFAEEPQGRRCPKCRKLLQTPGTDHDSPGDFFRCRNCNAEFQVPEVGARCLGCGSRYVGVEMQRLQPHDVPAYRLTPLGVAALAEQRLPIAPMHADTAPDEGLVTREVIIASIEDEARRKRTLGDRFATVLLDLAPAPPAQTAEAARSIRSVLLDTDRLGRLDSGHVVALLPGATIARARATLKAILALERHAEPVVTRGTVVELPDGGEPAETLDRAARSPARSGRM